MYKISRENFVKIKESDDAWLTVLETICIKELRAGADYIKHQPVNL